MNRQSDTQTWRTWLQGMIKDSRERGRIAEELRINPITLTRWAHNQSNPRPQTLHQLLRIFPEHRATLLILIQAEYPIIMNEAQHRESEELRLDLIPTEFYLRALRTRAQRLSAG